MPYCFVKGGVESYDCYVYSLSKDEARAIIAEFKCSQRDVEDKNCNKALIKLPGATEQIPFKLVKSIKIIEPANFMINVLERKFGYRIVCAIGDDPTTWTLHRPSSTSVLSPQLSSGNLKELLIKTDSRDKLLMASPASPAQQITIQPAMMVAAAGSMATGGSLTGSIPDRGSPVPSLSSNSNSTSSSQNFQQHQLLQQPQLQHQPLPMNAAAPYMMAPNANAAAVPMGARSMPHSPIAPGAPPGPVRL